MSWSAGGDVVRPFAEGGRRCERARFAVRATPVSPAPRRAVRVTRLALAALVVAVAVLLAASLLAHRSSAVAPPAITRVASGLDRLPLAARGPISRLLGAREDAFAVHTGCVRAIPPSSWR